jgi:hypothetical protein
MDEPKEGQKRLKTKKINWIQESWGSRQWANSRRLGKMKLKKVEIHKDIVIDQFAKESITQEWRASKINQKKSVSITNWHSETCIGDFIALSCCTCLMFV